VPFVALSVANWLSAIHRIANIKYTARTLLISFRGTQAKKLRTPALKHKHVTEYTTIAGDKISLFLALTAQGK
jgi:hypothetical protein